MERFKSEKIYPRIFAITIAIITSIIAIYIVGSMIDYISKISYVSKNEYIYIFKNGCIIISLVLLAIYLLVYYGREKSKLYNSSLAIFIVYLLIPIIDELVNCSMEVLPSKLSMAKIFFRIIMIIAVFLLLAENRKKRDGKVQILIFGSILTVMFIGFILSTSTWIMGGFVNNVDYWKTLWGEFVKNIYFLPYILCAFFCSKNYSILAKAKEKNIKLTKPFLKRIKKKK